MGKTFELVIHSKGSINSEQILNRYSNSVAIKEMQIKTKIKTHYILISFAKIRSVTIKSIVKI